MASPKSNLNWSVCIDSIRRWLDFPFSRSCRNRIITWLWYYLLNMKIKSALYLNFISVPACRRKHEVSGLRFMVWLLITNPLVFRFAWSHRRNPPPPPRRYQRLGSKRLCSPRHNFTHRKTDNSIWQASATQPQCRLKPPVSLSLYFYLWNNRYDFFFLKI